MTIDAEQRSFWGHFVVGGVYYDPDLDVPFTVTEIRRDPVTYVTTVVRADLDYACYGQHEYSFPYMSWQEEEYDTLWEPFDPDHGFNMYRDGDPA